MKRFMLSSVCLSVMILSLSGCFGDTKQAPKEEIVQTPITDETKAPEATTQENATPAADDTKEEYKAPVAA